MKYFTIKELCHSDTAIKKNIDNTPNSEIINNLTQLINNVLDPLREKYGKPIIVNGGYRCSELNKVLRGSNTSQHLTGQAADITVGSAQKNRQLFGLILYLDLPFDQLIDESNFKWIHVSFSKNPRKQILHL